MLDISQTIQTIIKLSRQINREIKSDDFGDLKSELEIIKNACERLLNLLQKQNGSTKLTQLEYNSLQEVRLSLEVLERHNIAKLKTLISNITNLERQVLKGFMSENSLSTVQKAQLDEMSNKLVIQTPKSKPPHKVAIILHGLVGNPNYPIKEHPLYVSLSESLVAKGFMTVRFVFNIDIEESLAIYTVESMISELNTLLSYLRNQNKIVNKNSISLVGHSAGGMIATLYGYYSEFIKCIVAIEPQYVKGINKAVQIVREKGFFEYISFGKTIRISPHHFESWYKNMQVYQHAVKNMNKPIALVEGSENFDEIFNDFPKIKVKRIKIKGADHAFTDSGKRMNMSKKVAEFVSNNS